MARVPSDDEIKEMSSASKDQMVRFLLTLQVYKYTPQQLYNASFKVNVIQQLKPSQFLNIFDKLLHQRTSVINGENEAINKKEEQTWKRQLDKRQIQTKQTNTNLKKVQVYHLIKEKKTENLLKFVAIYISALLCWMYLVQPDAVPVASGGRVERIEVTTSSYVVGGIFAAIPLLIILYWIFINYKATYKEIMRLEHQIGYALQIPSDNEASLQSENRVSQHKKEHNSKK